MKRLLACLAVLCLFGPASAQIQNPGGTGTVPWTSATTPNATTGGSVTLPTFTSLVAGFSITGGWNNAGNFPGLLVVNASPNTSSGATSLLADFQLAGVSQVNIDKGGNLYICGGNGTCTVTANGTGSTINFNPQNIAGRVAEIIDYVGQITVISGGGFAWSSNGTTASTGSIDIALKRNAAGIVEVDNGTSGTFADIKARSYIGSGSAPTIANGSCTFSSTNTQVGGNTVGTFSYAAGTCTAGQTFTITFAATAPNGWNCAVQDRTTSAGNPVKENSTTQTAVTMAPAGLTVAGDVFQFQCMAY